AVPTAAMWNGDLSNDVTPLGQPVVIYDPTTTQPDGSRSRFPGNIIPQNRFGPLAKVLQGLTAAPNNNTNPFQGPNFIKFYPDDDRQSNLMFKVDQSISDKQHLSVRVSRGWDKKEQSGGYYAAPASNSTGIGTSTRDTNIYNVGVDYTQSISNRWLNEIQAGVLRSYAHYGTAADFKNWDAILGMPNPFGGTGWPTFYACEFDCAYFGWDSDNNHVQALTQEVIQDNATFIKGKHTIQFGGMATLEQNNVEELQQEQGSNGFGPAYTSLWDPSNQAPVPLTGSGFAELLLDLPNYLSNQYNRGFFYFRQSYAGLYAQDKWQVAPRLTINYGLRWDYWTPYREAENRLAVPDTANALSVFQVLTPGSHSMSSLPGVPPAVLSSWSARGLQYTTANAAGYPSDLFRPIYHDFGPRIGIAYKLTNKTVLRGGFGIYYFPMPLALLLQSSRNNPPLNLRFENNPFQKNADFTYPYVAAPVPSDYLPAATVDINTPQGISKGAQGATIWDGRNWNDSREETWNVTLGRELWSHILMRVSYVGTRGMDLLQQYSFNNPEPQYNYAVRTGSVPPSNTALLRANPNWSLLALNHTGYSWDNSAQIQLERRFANGLSFQWFYTYSRALATADPSGFGDGNTGINSAGSFGGGGGATVPAVQDIIGEPNLSYAQRQALAYYNSPSIPPHRITFNASYMLPVGRGRRLGSNMSRVLDEFVGGWQVSTIT
ncbi:MAG: TonB-dependent receptor domain-containing protein, partial [Terriglobia bacterium]